MRHLAPARGDHAILSVDLFRVVARLSSVGPEPARLSFADAPDAFLRGLVALAAAGTLEFTRCLPRRGYLCFAPGQCHECSVDDRT